MLNLLADKIFVINLATAKDRLASFTDEMGKYNLEFERFDAIKPNGGATVADRFLGNKKSHLGCIQIARDSGYGRVIICEDDMMFDDDWANQFEVIFSEAAEFTKNNPWDIFYIGSRHKTPFDDTVGYRFVKKVVRSWCIHCYMVNSLIYDDILEGHLDYSPDLPCDVYYYEHVQKRGNCYCLIPRPAIQRPGYSDAMDRDTDNLRLLKDKRTSDEC